MTRSTPPVVSEIVTAARNAAVDIDNTSVGESISHKRTSALEALSKTILTTVSQAENNNPEAVRSLCKMLGLNELLSTYEAQCRELDRDKVASKILVKDFIKDQWNHAKSTWPIMGLMVLCFILFFIAVESEEYKSVATLGLVNLSAAIFIVIPRIFIREGYVNEDWGWLVAAFAILIFALFVIANAGSLSASDASAIYISQTMSLFWAPIASAMIMIPLMKVNKKDNSSDRT